MVTAKPELSGAGNELVLPGIVQAYIESPIYARTNGYLKIWYTDIGARVHKGELLAEIDTPEVDRELAQARADLDTAQANFALSKITNERWQGLLKTQAVSKQDADNRAGDAAAKAAMVESAQQNVQRLSDLESFKRVLAPFDGVVTARNTDVGYLINAGQSPGTELFRVADIHKLRIYAQVPEAYAAATETGLKAQLHFAERPARPTRRTPCARRMPWTRPRARCRSSCNSTTASRSFSRAPTPRFISSCPPAPRPCGLPANTMLFRSEGLQVAVVQNQDTIKIKKVDAGPGFRQDGRDTDRASIRTDAVVVNPPDSINDGMHVRIAPPPPKNPADQGGGHAAP